VAEERLAGHAEVAVRVVRRDVALVAEEDMGPLPRDARAERRARVREQRVEPPRRRPAGERDGEPAAVRDGAGRGIREELGRGVRDGVAICDRPEDGRDHGDSPIAA